MTRIIFGFLLTVVFGYLYFILIICALVSGIFFGLRFLKVCLKHRLGVVVDGEVVRDLFQLDLTIAVAVLRNVIHFRMLF